MTGTPHILFVCSGNICRSPFAEYLARDIWKLHGLTISSAGTWASEGQPATPEMIEVGAEYGLDLTPHRAVPLERVATPDGVLGMDWHHVEAARSAFPDLPFEAIRLLEQGSIDDPYGRGIAHYRRTAGIIETALRSIDPSRFWDEP